MIHSSLISRCIGLACCGAVAGLSLGGCASPAQDKTIVIRWQRLVDEKGDTCDRCGNTESAIDEAHRLLTASLKPLGIRVQVVKLPLSAQQFKRDPSESNRIWIDDASLDQILSATTGDSPCCGSCGDSNCRTMVVDGQTYEAIPPELILRAGLRVAADLVQPAAPAKNCCPSSDSPTKTGDPDLQPMPWLSQDESSARIERAKYSTTPPTVEGSAASMSSLNTTQE